MNLTSKAIEVKEKKKKEWGHIKLKGPYLKWSTRDRWVPLKTKHVPQCFASVKSIVDFQWIYVKGKQFLNGPKLHHKELKLYMKNNSKWDGTATTQWGYTDTSWYPSASLGSWSLNSFTWFTSGSAQRQSISRQLPSPFLTGIS